VPTVRDGKESAIARCGVWVVLLSWPRGVRYNGRGGGHGETRSLSASVIMFLAINVDDVECMPAPCFFEQARSLKVR
jgi:hypothetical protein